MRPPESWHLQSSKPRAGAVPAGAGNPTPGSVFIFPFSSVLAFHSPSGRGSHFGSPMRLPTASAIFDNLSEATPPEIMVKWPNDLYLSGRKVAGILVESSVGENAYATPASAECQSSLISASARRHRDLTSNSNPASKSTAMPLPAAILFLSRSILRPYRQPVRRNIELGQGSRLPSRPLGFRHGRCQIYEGTAQGLDSDGALVITVSRRRHPSNERRSHAFFLGAENHAVGKQPAISDLQAHAYRAVRIPRSLVRGLTHKMNNILSLFHGYLGLLIEDKKLDRETMAGLLRIRDSADAGIETDGSNQGACQIRFHRLAPDPPEDFSVSASFPLPLRRTGHPASNYLRSQRDGSMGRYLPPQNRLEGNR